jgi:tripartite-type tricarboxylate transporter receptor subunit TctC
MRTRPNALASSLAWVVLLFLPALVYSQAPFYQGKTITIVQGRDAGVTGDLRIRAMIPVLQKYIPGNPSFVNEYMPGGGSRMAANHIYKNARPDGLTIGNLSAGMVSLAVLGESGVLYDLDKLIYLGSPYSAFHTVFFSRKQAGLENLEKLRSVAGARIGASSVGFSLYNEGRLFAYLLRLKEPKFVTGYAGGELDVALARGEIDIRSVSAESFLRNPDWYEKRLVDVHTVLEIPKGQKHPRLPQIPELENFAQTDRERKLVQLQRAFRLSGAPFILPPGTPRDRVEILRAAFSKTYRDPESHKEHKKLTGEEPTPLMPEDHERAIKEIPRDREVIELFKELVGAGPLPPH